MVWSLKDKNGMDLEPLKFSNGKTQEDVVNEALVAIKEGHKIIFLKGVCGSGKSAIALNIVKECGRGSVVVPVKYLQEQYEKDYTENMSIVKDDGVPLNIKNLTGRNNFECIYSKGCKADDKFLPCTIELKKDNWDLIKGYIRNNEQVNVSDFGNVDDVRRISVAAACPHWSPVIGKEWFGDYGLKDAKQHNYKGVDDKDFTYYQRKPGCEYYEQYMSYINADVLIFNSRKYEIENTLDRKPATDVEIIDECDDFLDNLNNEKSLNLNFMARKMDEVRNKTDDLDVKGALSEIIENIGKIVNAKWLDEMIETEEIFELKETSLYKLLVILLRNDFLIEHEDLEQYYVLAKSFENLMSDSYVTFSRNPRDDIMAKVVNINLEKKLNEILDKNKVFVMMSGTLHSDKVLKNIFGMKDFVVIEAETDHRGIVRKNMTGEERSCRWKDFQQGRITREQYLRTLNLCVNSAEKPFLVHVNSYADLPTKQEKEDYALSLMSREKLQELQDRYRKGELLRMFKEGKLDVLYSTRCNRGVDLPGDMCKSIVFTKYPFPGMRNVFWRILQKKDPESFMEFYFDKAKREFIQRIYRGLRSHDDLVNLLSPDSKVLNSGI
ncbi:DEAD/DEAH box helicase family protein [Candidatus Woesearchaeota archaeon]|nr:DEAD/DEAH box helicase family protein [Candidatus Woesearchaeota archaeon]